MPPFAFRHQPLKALYLTKTVASVFIRLPFWVATNLIPSWRPRTSWTLGRVIIVKLFEAYLDFMYATEVMRSPSLQESSETAEATGFVWVEAAPDLVVGEILQMAEKNHVEAVRTGGFWYGPRGTDGEVGQKAAKGEKVIYHLHGGAYVMASGGASNTHLMLCFEGFHTHFQSDIRIFAPEYRLASAAPFPPANPYPACLVDAIAGFRYLVEDVGFMPDNILISGDSAGGSLAFALAYYLHTYQDQLVLSKATPSDTTAKQVRLGNAGGVLLVSPSVDWTLPRSMAPGSSMNRNRLSDYVYTIFESGYTLRALAGNLPEETVTAGIYISPGSLGFKHSPGTFAGLPRMCIVAGGAEQTVDAMRTLKDRLKADMGEEKVRYIEEPDAAHDCVVAAWQEPERTNVFKQIAEWMREAAASE
ncbi:alpha/beta-hydrolase [Fomitopsis serialis]|uniref:alpha/beta-hydrolase n=1 Tax=Fomitopsis serialis TaxID=139415 RepID=UPI002008B318|nr:alpha/beta-hydrolase [Neoantrodia serialis]KAH9934399.1 alpha/beta-hydrolase [Neoantrodia serialis]